MSSDPFSPCGSTIDHAVTALTNGKLACFPTDTLYALSADATSDVAVDAVYRIKGRPLDKPLPVFVDSIETACSIGVFDKHALRLAETFWPGALTLVVPLREKPALSPLVTGSFRSIGLRIPNHPVVKELLHHVRKPLIGTSANRSGEPPATSAEEIVRILGSEIAAVIDGGHIGVNDRPSTIVDLSTPSWRIVREGVIASSEFTKLMEDGL